MRRLLHILFLFFISASLFAQDKEVIDSLENLLKKTPDKGKAEIYNTIAREYMYNDDEKAIEFANKAFEYAKDFKNKKELAIAHLTFGASNIELKKILIAKESYKEALNIARELDDDILLADVLTRYGSFEDDYGNSDTGLIYLNEALELSKSINYDKGIKRALNYIGFSYYSKSEFSKAIEYFEQSYEISKAEGDQTSMEVNARVLGVCYYRQGNYTKAIERYIEALRFSDKIDNSYLVAANMLNIANVYKQQKYYNEAFAYLTQAKAVYESLNDSSRLASCYNNMSNVVREKTLAEFGLATSMDYLNKPESKEIKNELLLSKRYIDSAIIINEKLKDSVGLSSNYANRGIVLYFLHKYDEAEKEYNEALKIAEKTNDKRQICHVLQNAGELYYRQKKYSKSIESYNKSLELAQELNLIEYQQNNFEGISKVYEKYQNYKKAFENYKLSVEKKDQLFNEESQKTIRQMKEIYESDKKQAQIEKLNIQNELKDANIKRQKAVRNAMALGAIFLLGFLVFVFMQLRLIKRKNILLNEKNIQINQQKEEIEAQRDVVMKQKEEITDSIHYAQRIQRAVLASNEYADNVLPEHFILFRPRDIVSGDFYFITKKDKYVIAAAADCTGHGVPGAFMSMLGVSFLNEIVNKLEMPESHRILNHLRNYVKTTLDQKGKEGEAKDGMDIALLVFDFENYTTEYSGAYNSLLIVRPGEEEIIEYKADKMPIGIYLKEKESFTKNVIELKKGDMLYIFSDGYVDQFGGTDGRKFMTKNFKRHLMEIQKMSMAEQRDFLDRTIDEWRGETEQIDDIIVLGIRIE